MMKKALKAQAEWSPRSGNSETDALANGDARGFDPLVDEWWARSRTNATHTANVRV